MEISIGLPTTVPGAGGRQLIDVARRAEAAGFAGLGVIDRLVYDSYDSLTVLAAAAAATEHLRLTSTVLLGAYRGSGAVLAKQLATIDRLSTGRLVVGLAAGDRRDDFDVAGARFDRRGRRLEELVGELRAVWADPGPRIGPRPSAGEPPLLFGGHSDAAMRRAARHGAGWIAGGSSAATYPDMVGRLRKAWAAEGRADEPRLVVLGYVSLGPGGRERAEAYLRHYYAFIGRKAEQAASRAIVDGTRLRDTVAAYEAAGCAELVLFPCGAEPHEVDRIAAEVLS